MQIKWNNVIALGFALIVLVILAKGGNQIGSFLGAMTNVGPGHDPEEQVVGLIACGLSSSSSWLSSRS